VGVFGVWKSGGERSFVIQSATGKGKTITARSDGLILFGNRYKKPPHFDEEALFLTKSPVSF